MWFIVKMSERQRKKHGEGSFAKHIENVNDIEIADFINPWTFHCLFMSSNDVLFTWMRQKGLLASDIACPVCGKSCKLNKRSRGLDSFSFRCSKHSGVEISMRKHSFFEGSSYNIRDLCIFIKEYLEGHTLLQCALATGMDYRHTAVDWASFIREMFCEYTFNMYNMTQFEGEVEIDESLFGRKIKYNKGEPKGHRIWIFGIIHRQSNKLIIYPVNDRSADTLIPIIQRHVAPSSTIYSDSWAAYLKLNDVGYEHYSVCHKTTFKQSYKNVETGEIIHCHTNKIEGAWKHCKDHFRRINGTNLKMFEQHLAEIVWRNHHQNQNRYVAFFDLVKTTYPLDMPRIYTYPSPLFDTWSPPTQNAENAHNITIVRTSSSSGDESDTQSVQSVDIPQNTLNEEPGPSNIVEQTETRVIDETNITVRRKKRVSKTKNVASKDTSSDESEWEEMTSKKLFHPKSCVPVCTGKNKKGKTSKTKKLSNPYSNQAFMFGSDIDSDFA